MTLRRSTCVDVALLQCQPPLTGVALCGMQRRFVLGTLQSCGVHTGHLMHMLDGHVPVSHIVLNQATGSRTILHYRQLAELTAEQFMARLTGDGATAAATAVQEWRWIHFEGRALEETVTMLAQVAAARGGEPCWKRAETDGPLISVEVEKNLSGILRLLQWVDVAFVSREYSLAQGWTTPLEALQNAARHARVGYVVRVACRQQVLTV